jgi:hypothetical protein
LSLSHCHWRLHQVGWQEQLSHCHSWQPERACLGQGGLRASNKEHARQTESTNQDEGVNATHMCVSRVNMTGLKLCTLSLVM